MSKIDAALAATLLQELGNIQHNARHTTSGNLAHRLANIATTAEYLMMLIKTTAENGKQEFKHDQKSPHGESNGGAAL